MAEIIEDAIKKADDVRHIDYLLGLLRNLDQAGGLARESSRQRTETIAWLEKLKS